jgi:hypothetical protein
MRAVGFVLWGMLVACPTLSMAATAPVELLSGLQGEVCQGTETQGEVAEGASAPAQSPISLEWFRNADGAPSVDVRIGDRPAERRPVSIRGTGLAFENADGQVFLFRGNPGDISGSTTPAPGRSASFRLHCARRTAPDARP